MVENCLVLLALLAVSNTCTLLPTTQPQETLHCICVCSPHSDPGYSELMEQSSGASSTTDYSQKAPPHTSAHQEKSYCLLEHRELQ